MLLSNRRTHIPSEFGMPVLFQNNSDYPVSAVFVIGFPAAGLAGDSAGLTRDVGPMVLSPDETTKQSYDFKAREQVQFLRDLEIPISYKLSGNDTTYHLQRHFNLVTLNKGVDDKFYPFTYFMNRKFDGTT
jgi:hypothetical protein